MPARPLRAAVRSHALFTAFALLLLAATPVQAQRIRVDSLFDQHVARTLQDVLAAPARVVADTLAEVDVEVALGDGQVLAAFLNTASRRGEGALSLVALSASGDTLTHDTDHSRNILVFQSTPTRPLDRLVVRGPRAQTVHLSLHGFPAQIVFTDSLVLGERHMVWEAEDGRAPAATAALHVRPIPGRPLLVGIASDDVAPALELLRLDSLRAGRRYSTALSPRRGRWDYATYRTLPTPTALVLTTQRRFQLGTLRYLVLGADSLDFIPGDSLVAWHERRLPQMRPAARAGCDTLSFRLATGTLGTLGPATSATALRAAHPCFEHLNEGYLEAETGVGLSADKQEWVVLDSFYGEVFPDPLGLTADSAQAMLVRRGLPRPEWVPGYRRLAAPMPYGCLLLYVDRSGFVFGLGASARTCEVAATL